MPRLQLAYEGVFNGGMEVTVKKMQEMVDTAVDDIPVIPGHYSFSGEPASGWIKANTLAIESHKGRISLVGDVDFLSPMDQDYASEKYKHWSILAGPHPDFDMKYKLFHLGMLGAELPGIPGLEEIKASLNLDTVEHFVFSMNDNNINDNKEGESQMNIEELEKKHEELKLALNTANTLHETEKTQLQAKVDELTKANEDLELKLSSDAKRIAEFEKLEFSSLIAELEESARGKIPADELNKRVESYKERGIECKDEIKLSINLLSVVNSMAPATGGIVNNQVSDENKEDIKDIKIKGM